jgi:hypothetical protein
MPTEKQKREKQAWIISKPFLNYNSYAEYRAAQREVAKLSQDQQFFNGLQEMRRKQEQNFIEFLAKSEMGPYPKLVRFLNMDMSEFFKPRRRKR